MIILKVDIKGMILLPFRCQVMKHKIPEKLIDRIKQKEYVDVIDLLPRTELFSA